MPYVTLRYKRAKLYEEVWAQAVTKVAVRYGISDIALRKICKQLAVPLPPLGPLGEVGCREGAAHSYAPDVFRARRNREAALCQRGTHAA